MSESADKIAMPIKSGRVGKAWAPGKADSQKAEDMKRLTLDIPRDLHRAIKKDAAEEGVTMAEKLRALLVKHYG